jgi:MFS transporter, OFA family, oxalate/formate antiporter
MAVGNAVLQNIVLYVRDRGHELTFGASVMSGLVLANLAARLIVGAIGERTSLRFAAILSYSCLGVSVGLLMWASARPLLLAAGLLAGFGYGGSILMIAVLAGAIFGRRALGKILGCLLFSLGLGSAAGTVVVGRMFDISGTYNMPFTLLLGVAAASVAMISLVRTEPVRSAALPAQRLAVTLDRSRYGA